MEEQEKNIRTLQDLALLARIGEQEALETLLGNTILRNLIYSIANREVGPDHADDIYADVQQRIWKGITAWQGRGKITTWVSSIAKCACYDFYRKQKREFVTVSNEDFMEAVEPEQSHIITTAELLDILRTEILPKLGGRSEELMQLYLCEELDKDEIMEIVQLKKSFFYKKWKESCELLIQKIDEIYDQ